MKPLKRIYIEITNICNLSCSFCPPLIRPARYMSLAQFEIILNKITPYTDYIYLHIKGEPLIHPDLADFFELAHNYHLKVNLTTNGTLLSCKKHLLYQAKSLRQLNISLHSLESDTKQAEYMDEVLKTAFYLSEHTDTITALRLWNLNEANRNNLNAAQNSYVLNVLKETFPSAFLNENPARGIKLAERIYLNFDNQFSWPDMKSPYVGDTGSCYGLRTQLGILVDGTVVPCCLDENGVINLGNIFTDSLKDILESKKSSNISTGFIQNKITEPLCQHCGYRKRFLQGQNTANLDEKKGLKIR